MHKKQLKVAFAGFSLALALSATPYVLHAQTSTTDQNPPVAPAGSAEPNDISSASSKYSSTSVFVGGTPIMRVRFGAGGFSAEQRAAAIQERVNKMLGQGPIHPTDITVQDLDANDSGVYVKGQLLFTADHATARFNQTSAHDLAENWAATMRRVLPGLTHPK